MCRGAGLQNRLPKRSDVIESDPICIVERRGEGEFDAGKPLLA